MVCSYEQFSSSFSPSTHQLLSEPPLRAWTPHIWIQTQSNFHCAGPARVSPLEEHPPTFAAAGVLLPRPRLQQQAPGWMEGGAGYTSRCVGCVMSLKQPWDQPRSPHTDARHCLCLCAGEASAQGRARTTCRYTSTLATSLIMTRSWQRCGETLPRSSRWVPARCGAHPDNPNLHSMPCLQPTLHDACVTVMQLAYAINDEHKLQGAEINQLVSVRVWTRGGQSGLGACSSRIVAFSDN